MPNVSSTTNFIIPSTTDGDSFMMLDAPATVLAKQTFLADEILAVGTSSWTSANHTHATTDTGGPVSITNLTGILDVDSGGTGKGTLTDRGVLIGNSTSGINSLAASANYQLFVGRTSGDPIWYTPSISISYSGDLGGTADTLTMNSTGVFSGTLNPSVTGDGTHDHYMSDVGITRYNFSASTVALGGYLYTHSSDYLGGQGMYLDDNVGDAVTFCLPVFVDREVNEVRIRIKNIDGSTRTFYADIVTIEDDGSPVATGATDTNSINNTSVESMVLPQNWTMTAGTEKTAILRLWSNTSSTNSIAYGITILYSTNTGG
jgi:hypothetical protein